MKVLLCIISSFFLLFIIIPVYSQNKTTGLFTLVKEKESHLSFVNKVREDDSLNVFTYEYLYNGHGVGIADFNNDGLQDIFFSGNTTDSKLFLNKGNLIFEDVTKKAGVGGNGTWATGVSIADVNGDGLPDIYVCHSGYYKDPVKLSNQLFINTGLKNGVPVFKDMAKDYGLDLPGTQSTQAAFFDYDLDGDLDMFLLNHSNHTYNPFLNTRKQRATPDFNFGNRLFRNNMKNGIPHFEDITISAGIINNALNFGLGISISDINQDGWPDIYTTSDYTEQDCYYVNNKNGTFTQSLQKSFAHISKYSMGADIADYNNDGLPDVLTLDMLPEDNHRQKLLKGADEYDQYHLLVDSGYYHQQMRNMLHLNQGADAFGNIRFSEIGQFAGISNTDWSWAGLFADFDNDGWKDLLVTNGYLRDFTDLDFLKYTVADAQIEEAKKGNLNFRTYDLVKKMPSNKPINYLFRNNGDLTFSNVSAQWGFNVPATSNGAAYADLDNDGDLDLVICNNNEPVMLYRNNLDKSPNHHFAVIKLEGEGANSFGIGSRVKLYTPGGVQYQEQYPVRGYQSSMPPVLAFGLGKYDVVDSLTVEWPDGNFSRITNIPAGNNIVIKKEKSMSRKSPLKADDPIFTDVTKEAELNYEHKENDFIDFKDEVLLPYQLSKMGPALAKADVNRDGLEDVFIGGAIGQSGKIFLQTKEGKFIENGSQPWQADAASEDVNAIFFDADNDGNADLYVVSGGNEYADGSPEYADRLYINDGKGNFTKAALPDMLGNKQAVAVADYDNDGDLDIFVGGACIPGSFPNASRSYLLRNDSKGREIKFTDVLETAAKDLQQAGMIMTAAWADLDNDHFPELMIAGDWMPLMLFKNNMGNLRNISREAGLDKTDGMWSAIVADDIDEDGDIDFIIGNCGTNNQFNASEKYPMVMYVNDFDNNGTIDPIVCYDIQGKSYPMASRDELLEQIVPLRKKYVKYRDYADATIETIFRKEQIDNSKKYYCYNLKTSILINNGKGAFDIHALPAEAQFSKIYGILVDDFDKDGIKDIFIAGNFFANRVQSGRYDACLSTIFRGLGNNGFEAIPHERSGLYTSGEVRNTVSVNSASHQPLVILGKNDDAIQILRYK